MKINKDYRVKLNVLNILKDSFGAFVMNKCCYKKIPCINIDTGEKYEVNMGQYLLSIDYSIRLIEREILKLKQKSSRIKMIKMLLPW